MSRGLGIGVECVEFEREREREPIGTMKRAGRNGFVVEIAVEDRDDFTLTAVDEAEFQIHGTILPSRALLAGGPRSEAERGAR